MITVRFCVYLCTPDKRSNHTIRIYFFIRIYICIGCVALPPPRPFCQQGDAQRATHPSPRRSPPKGRDRDEKGVARKRGERPVPDATTSDGSPRYNNYNYVFVLFIVM